MHFVPTLGHFGSDAVPDTVRFQRKSFAGFCVGSSDGVRLKFLTRTTDSKPLLAFKRERLFAVLNFADF